MCLIDCKCCFLDISFYLNVFWARISGMHLFIFMSKIKMAARSLAKDPGGRSEVLSSTVYSDRLGKLMLAESVIERSVKEYDRHA